MSLNTNCRAIKSFSDESQCNLFSRIFVLKGKIEFYDLTTAMELKY